MVSDTRSNTRACAKSVHNLFCGKVQKMKCFPKTRVSSDTHLKISGNEKKENFAIGYMAKQNQPHEKEVTIKNKLTKDLTTRVN